MDQNETGKHMFRGINVFLRDKISDFAEILKRFPQDFKKVGDNHVLDYYCFYLVRNDWVAMFNRLHTI